MPIPLPKFTPAALAMSLLAGSATGQARLQTLVLTGEQASGLPEGISYASIGTLSTAFNNLGNYGFLATLAGDDITSENNTACFFFADGRSSPLVARTGDPVPGFSSETYYVEFTSGSVFNINNIGGFTFAARMEGPDVTSLNDWVAMRSQGSSGLQVVAREGDLAPGFSDGIVLGQPASVGLRDSGQMSLYTTISGPGVTVSNNYVSFFAFDGVNFVPVVRKGGPAPGLPAGVFLLEIGGAWTNDAGLMRYSATLGGAGIDFDNDQAYFVGDPDSGFGLALRTGQQAPGLDPGVLTYPSLHSVFLDNSGQLAFLSSLAGPGVTTSNDEAVFNATGDGGVTVIARKGDQAAGLDSGVVYGDILSSLVRHNLVNQTAFASYLTGAGVDATNFRGVFGPDGTSGLVKLIRSGEPVPGLSNSLYSSTPGVSELQLNQTGQVAAYSGITGGSPGDGCIVLTGTTNGTVLIAAVGQTIDVNNDPLVADMRTISLVSSKFKLNDAGQILFLLKFTDNSTGLFLADTSPCIADTNADGVLSPADFSAWVAAFNATAPECDQNGDGLCTPADFSAWVANYNAGC